MTIKKSLITTDWRAKGLLKGNPGIRSFRICFLLLILMMVSVAGVSAIEITSVSPTTGTAGYKLHVYGTFPEASYWINLSTETSYGAMVFGAAGNLTNVAWVNTGEISGTVPRNPAGTPLLKNIYVGTVGTDGASYKSNVFTYIGDQGPTITGINGSTNMKYVKSNGGDVINITGTWLGKTSSVTIGSTVNGTTIWTPFDAANDAVGNITGIVPASSVTGPVTISVTTSNNTASYSNLTYVAAPAITLVSPAYGSTFGEEIITIRGTGDFSGASAVTINNTAATFTVVNSTAVRVTTPPMPNIPSATTVNITTPGGASAYAVFTYYDPPNIGSLTTSTNPIQANVSVAGGTPVTITGSNFTSTSTVMFNGTAATSVTYISTTQLVAVAPAWPYMKQVIGPTPAAWEGTGLWSDTGFINIRNATVNVTTLGGTTKNLFGNSNITYDIFKPNITSISPTTGSTSGGGTLVITGKNLSYASLVSFYIAGGPALYNTTDGVTTNSDTQITCKIPMSTLKGEFTINVTTPAGFLYRSIDPVKYTYTAGDPLITTVYPDYGPDYGGQWVNITGSGFSGTATDGVVFNGMKGVGAFVFNDTYLTVQTPAYPKGAAFITINAAGGAITKQNAYTYVGIPVITSISPNSGTIAGGSTITITGTNLTRASKVGFNKTSATLGTNTDTSILVTLPPANQSATGFVNVNVTTFRGSDTIYGAVGTDGFNYQSSWSLISMSPTSGSISGGTFVILKGTNLNNATSVTFGGLPATNFTRIDAGTQISANTPQGSPGLVNPTIIIAGASTVTNTSVSYTYYGAPAITSISPSGGPVGTFVTITGTSFVGATQVTFDGIQATNFTYVDSTKITANAPAHADGAVSVIVAATGGTGTGTYTYGAIPTTTSTVGVFRNGVYYLASANQNGGGTVNGFSFGTTGDVPVTGVWSGSGSTTGVFRNGVFYLASANQNGGGTVNGFSFGTTGDVPVVVDNKVGVFRNGVFYLASANQNGGGTVTAFSFGMTNDVPVVVDNKVGVFRNGVFYLASANQNGGGTVTAFSFGTTGDVPVVWNHDGIDTVGVFRNGVFYLASANQNGGGTVTAFSFGMTNDKPVTGSWA